MGILTLLRNAFGRSRKGRTAEAEGATTTPSPEPTPQPAVPSPSPEPQPAATAQVPEPRVATPDETTDDEHELVSAAFDNVTVPKQGVEAPGSEEAAAGEAAAEEAAAEAPGSEQAAAEQAAAAEEPVTEMPAAEEPVAADAVAEEAVAETPVAEEPAAETSVIEKPTAEEPVAEESAAAEPVAEAPAVEEQVADQPATEEPAAESPAAEAPVAEESAAAEPVAQTPAAGEQATEEPGTKTPAAAEEPAVEEPTAKTPAAEEPATEEAPAAQTPAAEEPAAEAPAAEEPIAETPAVDEPAPEEPAPAAVIEEPAPEPEPVVEEPTAAEEPEPAAAPEPVAAAAADGEDAPQGPLAADDESVTGGAGGNTKAEGEAEAKTPTTLPPGLLTAYKAAESVLRAHDLTGTRAKVYLVLDRSASMRPYYKDGSAQALAEQTLALAAHLDPEPSAPTVPVVFFSTELDGTGELTLTDHENKIDELHAGLGRMGRTSYHVAVDEVVTHHTKTAPGTPALVVFQTDGAPDAKTPATHALTEAAKNHPSVFFSFVAFGDPEQKAFDYLRKLKTGNTAHFLAGTAPLELTDTQVYEGILATWRP